MVATAIWSAKSALCRLQSGAGKLVKRLVKLEAVFYIPTTWNRILRSSACERSIDLPLKMD
jgi:hypothetical protein